MHRVLARNGSDERALCAAGGWHEGAQIVPLLERSWSAVKTIAKQLYFHGTASHQDVCAALGLTDEGGPGSLGLAMIRGGIGPGTFWVSGSTR